MRLDSFDNDDKFSASEDSSIDKTADRLVKKTKAGSVIVRYEPQTPHPGRPETFAELLQYMSPFFRKKPGGELVALIHFLAEKQPGDNREELVCEYLWYTTKRNDLTFEYDCAMLGEEYRKSFEGKVRPGSIEYWLRYVRRKAKQLVEQGQYKP